MGGEVMEGVAPGELRPVTLTNLPEGLVGTLGIRLEDSDNAILHARSTADVTEFAAGSYRKWITFPETKGIYVLIADANGVEAIEEFRVTTDPLLLTADPLDVDWRPALVEVGALVRTRTKSKMGGSPLGTFTDNTPIKADEVEALISYATASVAARIGLSPCSDALKSRARGMAALYTAMLIELSYFPEQVGSDRSPYAKYKELYDDGMGALVEAVAENCGGGGDGDGESVGGSGPLPSSSFPCPSNWQGVAW
jgi:hypothetical protein